MAVKRVFDLIVGGLLCIPILPFMGIVALIIKLDSRGPVFYRQERMGRGGKTFQIFKFRSMHVGADEERLELAETQNDYDGPMFKLKDDPRITRVGGALRRWSIDELPQILNVMKGDMSLVGPRPLLGRRGQAVPRLDAEAPRHHARHHRPLAGAGRSRDPLRRDGEARLHVRHRLEPELGHQAAAADGARGAQQARGVLIFDPRLHAVRRRHWRGRDVKVLMLLPDPAVKGAMARLGAQLVDALRRLDADVVPCRWGRHADRESLLASVCGRVMDFVHICRLLREGEFDVLFVNTAHDRRALLRDVPLLIATQGRARRRVLQFHGSFSNDLSMPGGFMMKAASRWLARRADAVLMLSSEEVDQWRAFEPRGRYRVVANPYVATRRRRWNAAKMISRERQDATPVVLFVGRLLAAKGIFDLVDAVARVRQRVDCRLCFAGGEVTRML